MRMLSVLVLLGFSYMGIAEAQEYGAFQFHADVDPVTDMDASGAVTVDENNSTGGLVIRCMAGGLNLLYIPYKFNQPNDKAYVDVIYRLDKKASVGPTRWILASSGKGVFAPSREATILLKAVLKSRHLVLRATDYNGTKFTNTFSFSGLQSVLKKLSCAKKSGLN